MPAIMLIVVINNCPKMYFRTKRHVRTILPAMQLLDGMLQKILKAEELSGVCYELGPIGKCSQCKTEKLFTYITYNTRKKQDTPKRQRRNHQSLQCSKCQNEVFIKCNQETDKIIKSKV